ncbi:MAG TPA: 2-hydroxyacid dehydrogenase [Clostridiales bacterium]|nr:2-hydroxyacid dehydrogenase [Clostridiales bacterium]
MKLVGIGDLFIPKDYIKNGFQPLDSLGVDVNVIDWELKDFTELQNINLLVENGGSEAYEPPEYIFDAVEDADIIITQFCTVNSKMIDRCKNLKVIGVLRAGYENINVDYASRKGILVYNTPGRNADAVADFTVGMMIAECRNIARGHLGLKEGIWIREYPNSSYIPDLPGKTVGIVGLGEIGLKVAKRLTGFDMKIIGYDPYAKKVPDYISLVPLEELMRESDFVTIHARLTKETERMINTELISLMKPASYLINTSRSALVDEKALYRALKEGRLAGAALDVFDVEPPGIDYPLVKLDNVTITPHMAGGSSDAFLNSPRKLAAEIAKIWEGKPSGNLINKELFNDFIKRQFFRFEQKKFDKEA